MEEKEEEERRRKMGMMKKVCQNPHNHTSHFVITDAFCISPSHILSLLSSISSLSVNASPLTACIHI